VTTKNLLPCDVFATIESWETRRLVKLAEWVVDLYEVRKLAHDAQFRREKCSDTARRLATSFEEGDLRKELEPKTPEERAASDDFFRKLRAHMEARRTNGAAE